MRWLPTVFQKVTSNSYVIYDGLIISLDAALGRQGRAIEGCCYNNVNNT